MGLHQFFLCHLNILPVGLHTPKGVPSISPGAPSLTGQSLPNTVRFKARLSLGSGERPGTCALRKPVVTRGNVRLGQPDVSISQEKLGASISWEIF